MSNSRIQRIKMALPHRHNRQMAVILFTDIVGYTALMQRDEKEALQRLNRFKEILLNRSGENAGTIIQYYGDGGLLLFANALEATQFAIQIQDDFRIEPQIPVRVGLHAGDVLMKEGLVFGDTVNLASRIESLGIPGSVLLSETVRNQLRNQQDVHLAQLGAFHFKNVAEPMTLFAVSNPSFPVPLPEEMEGKLQGASEKSGFPKQEKNSIPRLRIAVVAMALIAGAGYFIFKPAHDPWMTTSWKNSIAILPFDNLNTDTGKQYIAIGVADEIRNQLATIPSLKVTSRSSSMFFKNKELPARQIGESLQAAYILDGTVQQTDSLLKISLQLTNATSDIVEWAPVFERKVNDVFSIQEEIAMQVVDKLELDLSRRERKQLEKQLSLSSITYDMYFRAIDHLSTVSVEQIRSGSEWMSGFLQQTKQLPLQATNLAWLSILSNTDDWQQGGKRDSMRTSVTAYLQEASKLDVASDKLYSVQGAMRFYLDWDIEGAEKQAKEAIHHGDEQGYILLADILIRTGRSNEAVEVLQRMMKLDPLNPEWLRRYGWASLNLRHVEEARKAFEQSMTFDSISSSLCLGLACVQMYEERKKDALRWLDTCEREGESPLRKEAYRIILLYDTGDHEQAVRRLGVLKRMAEDDSTPEAAFSLACAYAGMNLHDEALKWILMSHDRRENAFLDVWSEPVLYPVRTGQAFKALISKTVLGHYLSS